MLTRVWFGWLLGGLSLGGWSIQAAEDGRVLAAVEGQVPPDKLVSTHLHELALAALARRDAAYEQIKTPDQLQAWQRERKQFFLEQLGGFPERTPLNARVTGEQRFADYRIEKVIFESQPGFFVTGTLYLPLTPGPHPAVLHPTGHSPAAKARDLYQQASIVMVKAGLAVLCFDPVGQGERRHFFDAKGQPRFSGTTSEHQLMGVGCTLLGTSVARYMIWDAMRAIDYLQARPDIDGQRIGCTGISGGGTQTSYLMALDERVRAAAPGCYLTGYRALLSTIGPQDSEQNIYGQLAFGMDHADYVMMTAPRATLVMAATQDYFDIGGAWELFRQSKRFFGRWGWPERVEMLEVDDKHGFPTEMRVGAARWMRRWLMQNEEPVFETDFPVLPEADLLCTPEGQVLKLPGARSLFDLNREWEERLSQDRARYWQSTPSAEALAQVRRLAGVRPLSQLPAVQTRTVGTAVSRSGYRRERVLLQAESTPPLPALLLVPTGPVTDAYLYLHGQGKQAEAGPEGEMEKLAQAGHLVLALDLRGLGETAARPARPGFDGPFGANWRDVAVAYLLGKSFVGMRAEDTLMGARFLASYPGVRPERVHLVAVGETGVPALHAAALEPALFASVKITGMVPSWSQVVREPLLQNQWVNTVYGALRVYDLPDLVRSLPAGRIRVEQPSTGPAWP